MTDTPFLVSTDWLGQNIQDTNIRIIDATWHLPTSTQNAKESFQKSHIPGAVFFDIDEIADLENALPHMMPSDEKMASRIRAMGITNTNHIIIYDNSDFCTGARAWFMFKNFGHDKVSILDGGYQKWQKENKPIETEIKGFPDSHFKAKLNQDRIRHIDQITQNIQSKEEQVVDARASGRFRGTAPEPRPNSKAGHIPGSFNVPFNELLNADKTYKSVSETIEIFEKAGIDLSKPIITSCGSGVTACVLLFALERIGHHQNALYDGSWSEWGTDPDTEIEK